MTREELATAIAAALEADGYLPPGDWQGEMASVAIRRWQSFVRRSRSKHPTDAERLADLAKGLREHFDPNRHDHKLDYVHYAKIILPILKRVEIAGETDPAQQDR